MSEIEATMTGGPSKDVVCAPPDCHAPMASVYTLSGPFTTMNIFGFLLVYGLGLILAAALLNTRRHARIRAEAEAAGVVPPPRALPDLATLELGREDTTSTLHPLKERWSLLKTLERTVEEHGGGHRVAVRPDLTKLRRPEGRAEEDWQKAMEALRNRRADFAIIDAEGRVLAAAEYLDDRAPGEPPYPQDKERRQAIEGIGVRFLQIGPGTKRRVIRDWAQVALTEGPPA